jgi:hypothetical protein
MLRIAPVLHLTRVTTAFAAVANVWFVILWTRAASEFEGSTAALARAPLWLLLAAGALNALALFAYAAALNDILDYRRDRLFHPERPLPSGQLSLDWAVALVVGTFMLAILGATALGMQAVLLTVLLAAAVLFFHAAGKFVPGIGLVVLGLIYAGQMVVPNLNLRFVWPVWLVMTHALAIGGIAHAVGRKVPAISRRAAVFAAVGWVFWSAVIFYAGWWRCRHQGGLWPEFVKPWVLIGPLGLALLFALLAWQKVRISGLGPRAAEKLTRYGALWLALYDTTWLVGQGYTSEAAILGALTGAGFLGMTVLREIYGLLEQPLGYRR